MIISTCNKIIRLMKRQLVCLPRKALLTIYKSFVQPHFDENDIVYDKPDNKRFINNVSLSRVIK